MATDQEQNTVKPWYLRGKTLILTAGALAAAGLGILNFWDRIFPPDMVDVATIESIVITKQTTLGDYASGVSDSDLFPLNPAPAASAGEIPAAALVVSVPDAVATPTPLPLAPAPAATPTPTPTSTPAPTGTISPSPGGDPTKTPEATSTPTKTSGPTRWTPTKDYLNSLKAQDALAPYVPPVRDAVHVMGGNHTGPNGEELPPGQLAERLRIALEEVESEETEAGVDPLGWTVAIRLILEGLDDVPLLLTWSLDGTNVPTTWSADNVAYRVVATTPRDAGSAEIWVPDLETPGVYNVNVRLERESDGTIAAIGEPLQISNE